MEFWLVAAGTIDEKLAKVLQVKQGHIDQIIDGKEEGTSSINVYDQVTQLIIAGRK